MDSIFYVFLAMGGLLILREIYVFLVGPVVHNYAVGDPIRTRIKWRHYLLAWIKKEPLTCRHGVVTQLIRDRSAMVRWDNGGEEHCYPDEIEYDTSKTRLAQIG